MLSETRSENAFSTAILRCVSVLPDPLATFLKDSYRYITDNVGRAYRLFVPQKPRYVRSVDLFKAEDNVGGDYVPVEGSDLIGHEELGKVLRVMYSSDREWVITGFTTHYRESASPIATAIKPEDDPAKEPLRSLRVVPTRPTPDQKIVFGQLSATAWLVGFTTPEPFDLSVSVTAPPNCLWDVDD